MILFRENLLQFELLWGCSPDDVPSQLSYTPIPIINTQKVCAFIKIVEIYILIGRKLWSPLVTRLPNHQKNAPLKYYMI